MARILFVWELGGGVGYVDRLHQVASAVAAEGHEAIFCIRDLIGTADFMRDKPWVVMQSPLAVGLLHPTQPQFIPGSYGDLLWINNFNEPEHLYRLVHAWQMLFLAVRPDVIVGEYAPYCAVAAWGRIPFLAMGHGYILPPVENAEFPIFDPGAQRQGSQEQLLHNVRTVLQRVGGVALPDTLPVVIGGTHHFVTAFAETDPYAQFRSQRHVGPLETFAPPSPPPAQTNWYAYLSATHPNVRMILQSLAECGVPGSIYMKRMTSEMRQFMAERGVHVYDRPPPLDATVRSATVVVHHGGMATLTAAIAAGRPQVLWSEVADQQVSANTIDKLGISVHGRRRLQNAAQGSRAVRELCDPAGEAAARAYALGQAVNQRGEYGSLSTVCATVRQYAG